jgi:thiol-disulfide isomerase/thioredoxin
LFSQDKCKYCQEFLEAFVLLSKANQSIAVFSKVNYQSTTKTLFEKYEITSTPTVLAF